MKTFDVGLTCIYNGSVEVEAENEQEALEKAQELLCGENLAGFPDYVEIPNGSFSFGEATADYINE